MATVTRDSKGARVWFKDGTGKRKSIRLGDVHDDYATRFACNLEDLNTAVKYNATIRSETAQWAMGLCEDLQNRLAALGLIEIQQAEPEPDAPKLGAFVDAWIAGRHDVKPTSKLVYGRCRNWLVEYFGEDRRIDDITEGDADEWAAFLRSKLGENTARKMASVAKQVFKHAVRKRFIESNSFTDLSAAVRASDDRSQFVTRAEIDKAIAVAPDVEWELIIALARYGGLRMPSELFPLKWRDINLTAGRMTITSPKTEHHTSGGSRVCPIFPELRKYFEQQLLAVSDGTGRVAGSRNVIEKHRLNSGNLSTQFTRILTKAGVTPWPKLMINLRSSRQTELENTFPTHVVCKWLGNSPQIAHRHYLKVTDSHFDQAIGGAPGGANGAEVVQNKSGHGETKPDTETPESGEKHGGNIVPPTKNGVPEINPETPFSGRYWTRTNDLHDVNVAL